jgi:hypothetical protein
LGIIAVEEDGMVVPISYGFARRYAVCNLRETRLVDAWPTYLSTGYQDLRALTRSVFEEIVRCDDIVLRNWHELVVTRSHEAGRVLNGTERAALEANG